MADLIVSITVRKLLKVSHFDTIGVKPQTMLYVKQNVILPFLSLAPPAEQPLTVLPDISASQALRALRKVEVVSIIICCLASISPILDRKSAKAVLL